MPRLFSGLEVPSDVGLELSMQRGGLPGARWITPDHYHVTLRFIGDVDEVVAQEIDLALSRVRRGPFEMRLDGLTSFGGRKPRAIVSTVAPSPALLELQHEHERLMQRIGLEPEGRKYTPHVTLARLRDSSSRDVAEYLAARIEPAAAARRTTAGVQAVPPHQGPAGALRRRSELSAERRVIPKSGNRFSDQITRKQSAYAALNSRDCASKIAVATLWLSTIASRISDSTVDRGGSTSPTTPPKSNDRPASNLRASCCMR